MCASANEESGPLANNAPLKEGVGRGTVSPRPSHFSDFDQLRN